jgi:hypothetical protein
VFVRAMVGYVLASDVLVAIGIDKHMGLRVVYMVVMVGRRVNML